MKPYVPSARNVRAKVSPLSTFAVTMELPACSSAARRGRAVARTRRRAARRRRTAREYRANTPEWAESPQYNAALVVTKPVDAPPPSGDSEPPEPPPMFGGDIRSVRLIPSAWRLRALGRRLFSILALVAIDLGGIAAALYLALVVRELYYGERPILWGLPWDAETKWLPFLV